MALSLLHCPVSYTKHGAPVGLLCLGEQAAAEKAARAAQGVLELLDQQLGSQAAPALGLLSNRRQVFGGLFFHTTGHFLSDSNYNPDVDRHQLLQTKEEKRKKEKPLPSPYPLPRGFPVLSWCTPTQGSGPGSICAGEFRKDDLRDLLESFKSDSRT